MRKLIQTLVAGALAVTLAAPALADPPRHSQGRGYDRGYDRDYRDNRRGDHRRYDNRRGDHRRYDNRRQSRRDARHRNQRRYSNYRYAPPPVYYAPPRYSPPVYYAPRRHVWRPGGYLPRHTSYRVVHDYHRYRLAPPRHGHYYADVNGDILLIAAATGLIVWALNN